MKLTVRWLFFGSAHAVLSRIPGKWRRLRKLACDVEIEYLLARLDRNLIARRRELADKEGGGVMGDQVYRVEELRKQVLDLLRAHAPMKAGEIAMSLRLPMWAVMAALESGEKAGLMTYVWGVGYELAVAPVKGEAR